MDKIEKLFDKLGSDIDCALITSDINRRYFCGMKSSAGYIVAFREKSYLLIDFRYIEKAKLTVKNCEVILLTNFKEQICDLLKKHNAKTIAVERETLTISKLERIKTLLNNYTINSSNALSEVISELRIIKSQDEIDKIISAQRIAEKAFDNVLNFIREGVTEKEIALQLDFYMLRNGAEDISFETIALTGKNTSLPHGVPSDTKVKKGDFVLMDFGAVYEGYHSDMTRTICIGNPSEEMQKIYNIVLTSQQKAIESVKSGLKGKELDNIAREYIKENGYGEYFGHALGHGVGMEIHEQPNASISSETEFKENMIVTVEPGIYLPGKFGVRIEDFVIVKNEKCENITKSVKKLISI